MGWHAPALSARQPSSAIQFWALESDCPGSDPGNAIYQPCNLTNYPGLIFLIYKMELMIAFHRLLGGIKDNEHRALCINAQYRLDISIPHLCPCAMVWPRLTSHLVSSPHTRLSGLACGGRYDAGEHGGGVPSVSSRHLSHGRAEAPASANVIPLFVNHHPTIRYRAAHPAHHRHEHNPADAWGSSSGSLFVEFSLVKQKSANFYAKGQSNYLGLCRLFDSVATTPFCIGT